MHIDGRQVDLSGDRRHLHGGLPMVGLGLLRHLFRLASVWLYSRAGGA